MKAWIDIKDELPEVGVEVLVVTCDKDYAIAYWSKISEKWEVSWSDDLSLGLKDVSHWMPLPLLPFINTETGA